jgi:catechol 2,3-dioxygenase-like lactoylglutathione lyase family enzyme
MRRIVLLACLISIPALAQRPTRPAITGVAFARFYTTDPVAAQRFYGSTLGLERKESGGMWIYPVNHSQWVELITKTKPPQPNTRLAAVAFTTANVAQMQRYLEAHDIKPEIPLKDGQFGVRDPEGNLVIFVQQGSEKLVGNASKAPNATSSRIIHVGFMVTDQAKEDAFWKGILGFRPYWHGGPKPDVDNWVSIQVPDAHPAARRCYGPLLPRC